MQNRDFSKLSDTLVPFAKQMLEEHGEFYPFAVVMKQSGDVQRVAASMETEYPTSHDVISVLIKELRRQAGQGEIKAAGICVDVRTAPPGETEKKDAICTLLEHSRGDSIVSFVPYEKSPPGRVAYGEVFSVEGEKNVFRK